VSVAAALPTLAPLAGQSLACHHCGEPAPDPAFLDFDGAHRAFCCRGCAAAAQWIRDAELGDYYRLRSAAGQRVRGADEDLAAWDRDDLMAGHVRAIAGGCELTLLVDGMRCAACAWLIDRALAREPGVLEASANAVTGRVRLAWDPGAVRLSRLLSRLLSLGYRPFLSAGEETERQRRSERKRWLLRLGVAGLGAVQAMMFAEALFLDSRGQMPVPTRDFLRWITFLVATPVVWYSGWPFLLGAWRELRYRRLGMDTLIAGSTLLAYFASLAETLRGGPHVWYDAAVMFVFLLLAARMLEQRARAIANAQVDALARARPAFATRETGPGQRETVPLSALRVGDVACVAAGEMVPADGLLLEPAAWFDQALLTGESTPVAKQAGGEVFAGTVCRELPARLAVTGTGSATRLSQLVRLVERAQAHRPKAVQLADRIAGRFVLGLLLVAALTWIGWHRYQPERAFEVTLAMLVISCPCALSLSVPAVLAAAHGALARIGVLVMQPEALARLAAVTDVVFDKTGTLSDGCPVLAEVATFDGFDGARARAIAAALERDAGHPLAAAFACNEVALLATQVRAVAGQGVSGLVEGRPWRLGRRGFAAGADHDDEGLWLGDGQRAFARFEIRESPRAEAREAVAALTAAGLSLHMSSGDSAQAVDKFARAVGIANVRSRQFPQDKLATVRALQARACVVAMVGDGSNDAPVLAGADVAIAIGTGAALAHQAADLVLVADSLLRIPQAIALARRSQRAIRQNLGWAIGYNLLAIPVAAAGWVTPWLAALGMALSSLLVTGNALRLTRGGQP
jgi:Cu2+-exporting ATPase